jgi:hypothetical protein
MSILHARMRFVFQCEEPGLGASVPSAELEKYSATSFFIHILKMNGEIDSLKKKVGKNPSQLENSAASTWGPRENWAPFAAVLSLFSPEITPPSSFIRIRLSNAPCSCAAFSGALEP